MSQSNKKQPIAITEGQELRQERANAFLCLKEQMDKYMETLRYTEYNPADPGWSLDVAYENVELAAKRLTIAIDNLPSHTTRPVGWNEAATWFNKDRHSDTTERK